MPLEDDDILPPHAGQMICNAAASNTSTNDNSLSMRGKISHFYLPPKDIRTIFIYGVTPD
jgi:hypothetical protein